MPPLALCLLPVLSGIICPAVPEPARTATQEQKQILNLVRESSHVIAVGLYKREILPETSDPGNAQEIFHAFVVRSIKGGLPEGQPIIWAQPMKRLTNGTIYTHAIFAGKPYLHYLIGNISGEFKGNVKIIWKPAVITPEQKDLHTAFTGLLQHRPPEWEQALKPPVGPENEPMNETFWKDFAQRMEQAETNSTDKTTFTF